MHIEICLGLLNLGALHFQQYSYKLYYLINGSWSTCFSRQLRSLTLMVWDGVCCETYQRRNLFCFRTKCTPFIWCDSESDTTEEMSILLISTFSYPSCMNFLCENMNFYNIWTSSAHILCVNLLCELLLFEEYFAGYSHLYMLIE